MTREEQIRQAGIEYTIKNRPMCIGGGAFSEVVDEMSRNRAFEEGAKWADETQIGKVLKFIFAYFYEHPHVNGHICTDSFESLEELEEELIKVMEE
jgi:hypothetical protein